MITQSYTSFLNNVHQKSKYSYFFNKSQRVNRSTSQRVEVRWVWLGRMGLKKENTH